MMFKEPLSLNYRKELFTIFLVTYFIAIVAGSIIFASVNGTTLACVSATAFFLNLPKL